MTELTTIEKIDAMLAALDEGTRGPYREIAHPQDNGCETCGREDFLGYAHAVGAGAGLVICHIGFDQSPHDKDARNIAWLLNAARPMLEAAKRQWQAPPRSGINAMCNLTVSTIIDPLWKAFTEAQHG